MADLNLNDLVNSMVAAAKSVLNDPNWSTQLSDAEDAFNQLGNCIIHIEEESLVGKITQQDAQNLIDMQKNAIQSVLLQVQGMGEIMAQQAINSAINAVSNIVNTAIGWSLL